MAITLTTIAGTTNNTSIASVNVNTADVGDIIVAFAHKNGEANMGFNVNTTVMIITSSNTAIRMAYLVPSATGAQTVTSTGGGLGGKHGLIASVWSGVNTTTPIASTVNSSGASSVASGQLTGASSNVSVCAVVFNGQSTAALTSGTGMVIDMTIGPSSVNSTVPMVMAHKAFSSITETVSMNITASTLWWLGGVVLANAAAAVTARQQIVWMQ